MNVTDPGASAYISIGSSFLSGLSDYFSQILTPKGILTTKTDNLNKDLNEYNEDLVDLDEEIALSRSAAITNKNKQHWALVDVDVTGSTVSLRDSCPGIFCKSVEKTAYTAQVFSKLEKTGHPVCWVWMIHLTDLSHIRIIGVDP